MDIVEKLNRALQGQDFPDGGPCPEALEQYRDIPVSYSLAENTVSVLSDMKSRESFICYGGFAKVLGLDRRGCPDKVYSIWEKDILQLVHPDDLRSKYLHEMRFFQFIKRQPRSRRGDYYLAERLRMKDVSGNYVEAMHRLFYPPYGVAVRLALCLYGPMVFRIPSDAVIVNSLSGQMETLERQDGPSILTDREIQILRLIDRGMMSKDIASLLSISINTVSRHRQEILSKLKVRNSIEACRVAKDLGLM